MKSPDWAGQRWFFPAAGTLLGLLYVLLDEGIMDTTPGMPGWAGLAHEFLDFILPLLCGTALGACAFFIRRERALSRRLSLKFDRARQDLLFNTLISQMLHEIQNPLHNLSAALEDETTVPPATRELVARNLSRLAEIKTRYGQWGAVLDNLDPEEPVDLSAFIRRFIDEKIGGQARELGVSLDVASAPVRAFIHPVFLEQILSGLLSNAFAALEKTPARGRRLSVRVALKNGAAQLEIANSGAFPDPVLGAQGLRPSPSRGGLGLGLLLTRSLLEQVGGSLHLENQNSMAVAVATLRGEPL